MISTTMWMDGTVHSSLTPFLIILFNIDIFVSCGGNQSPKAAMQLHFALDSRPYSPKAVEDLAAITVLWGSNKHQPEGQVVGKVSVLVSAQNWKIKNTPMKSINTPFPCPVQFCFSSFYPPGKLPAKTKTWKLMVGRWKYFLLDGLFSGGMLVWGRVVSTNTAG